MVMKITHKNIEQIVIDGGDGLDPVRVMWENYSPGQGRITMTCYGRAWTAAWFAMAGATIEQFFIRAYPDYILSNMTSFMAPGLVRNKKNDEKYLMKVILAAQEGMRQHLHTQGSAA